MVLFYIKNSDKKMIKHEKIKEILIEASKIIENYFNSNISFSYKEDNTPVTVADSETNVFLKNKLLELLPNSGWLSEEDIDDKVRLDKEYVWVVDPLDGTREFTNRVPEFAISIGLVKNNKAVLGALINPITKEGGICSIWGENIFFGFIDQKPKSDFLSVIVSRTEYNDNRLGELEKELKMKPVGSVAYKLLRIASGQDDMYFSVYPKSEWDICGGVALLELSGNKYLRFDRKENLFNQDTPKIESGAIAGKEQAILTLLDKFSDKLKTHNR